MTPNKQKIAIASDHGGVELKSALAEILRSAGYALTDLGTDGAASVDYPDYADKLAKWMMENPDARGVLICGSGIGISIAANRFAHIRAALCHDGLTAKLSRQHNDANVLCLGARVIGIETAKDCLNNFLNTEFEGGRHAGRVEKLSKL